MKEKRLKYDRNNTKILVYWYACILYYQVVADTLVHAYKRENASKYE